MTLTYPLTSLQSVNIESDFFTSFWQLHFNDTVVILDAEDLCENGETKRRVLLIIGFICFEYAWRNMAWL